MSKQLRRLLALMKKETLQVWRDPSCILIAFVLPMILLFIFGFGLSLDAKHVKVAFVTEEYSPIIGSLWSSFQASEYIDSIYYENLRNAEEDLVNNRIMGVIVLKNNFAKQLLASESCEIQLITDGSQTNTAEILNNYVTGIVFQWRTQQGQDRGIRTPIAVELRQRILFNPELKSCNALIPGSIAIITAIIGTLLTSLIVAREWERGTMEAMLATPIRPKDMILGKLIPYYVLGVISTVVCLLFSIFLFRTPFRGSIGAMFLVSTMFILASLALGFLISTLTKNQYQASVLAFMFTFLPNTTLSGAVFEINSMPLPIRIVTYIFPARYYVTCLQTIFMTGDVWPLFLPNLAVMAFITMLLFAITIIKTPKRLQ
ncbi:MAG: ABC transporter permease [Planctomycetaceae bacterium]|jgi:ABC-2 type transport system permease protein|nr:ABC transporter permease [Planctomycetaceae bacterium]